MDTGDLPPRADPSAGRTAAQTVSALVALQGAALIAVAGFYLVELLRRAVADPAGSVAAAGIALVVGVGLLVAARGLLRRRAWARAPSLVAQLIILLVAVGPNGFIPGGSWLIGGLLAAWAGAVLVLLFAPGASSAGGL